MSTYDDYDDDHSPNLLAAYKPRAWKTETALSIPVYSKPEPTSKTNIPSKNSFINEAAKSTARQHA